MPEEIVLFGEGFVEHGEGFEVRSQAVVLQKIVQNLNQKQAVIEAMKGETVMP